MVAAKARYAVHSAIPMRHHFLRPACDPVPCLQGQQEEAAQGTCEYKRRSRRKGNIHRPHQRTKRKGGGVKAEPIKAGRVSSYLSGAETPRQPAAA